MTSIVRRASRAAEAVLKLSLLAALAVIVSCINLQVVMRYAFKAAPSWTEELSLLAFSWITLGGLAYGVREGFHVSLGVAALLPDTAKALQTRALALLTLCFGLFVAVSGARFVEFTLGETSAAIRYPIEILHGLPAVSGLLIVLFSLESLIEPRPHGAGVRP